jgi:hypothetical protein
MERVAPDKARKGECIETYPVADFARMRRDGARLERVLRRATVRPCKLVYTLVPGTWNGKRGNDTWQIYLLNGK